MIVGDKLASPPSEEDEDRPRLLQSSDVSQPSQPNSADLENPTDSIKSHNEYADITALRPLKERIDQEAHPSQIVEANSQYNYYRYGWMQEAEPTSAMNISVFCTLIAMMLLIGYLLTGTKLLKFIRFFLTKKQYKRLNISLKPDLQTAEVPYETGVAEVTPRGGSSTAQRSPQSFQLLKSSPSQSSRGNGLISHLSHHARSLIQFYAPTLATVHMIGCCTSSLALPRYVIAWQLVTRLSFIVVISAAIALAFVHGHFDEKTRSCLLSHELRASSFYCLNKLQPEMEETAESYRGALQALGCLSALICSASMLALSHSIFANFTSYLDQLLSANGAKKSDPEATLILRAPEKQQLIINTQSESSIQITQKSPERRRVKSPSRNKQKQMQDQSISSFRALLDRDSDSSSFMPNTNETTGYDSGYGHMSMSTSTGLANNSERAGALLNMSLSSARDGNTSSQGPKRFNQAGGAPPDLLPIDEDVDDEKCSPIKPKRRTDEDSPFKKHLAKQLSIKKSEKKNDENQPDQLIISDDDEGGVRNTGQVSQLMVGGFGIELDRPSREEHVNEDDISSLNLNSGIATPPRRRHSSPHQTAEMKLDELIENELSAIPSQGAFRIQVEQIEPKVGEESSGRCHFEGLNTLGSNSKYGEGGISDPNAQPIQTSSSNILSGPSNKRNGSSQMPTIQVNSFSNVDDSTTLQLETLGQFKQHRVPSSTRNGMPLNNNATEQGQNIQMFSQPLSVREANRPATGVNLGMITPLQASGNNDDQTDDRNSLGFNQLRNTVEVLSSDPVSKNSGAIRQEAHIQAKMVKKSTFEPLKEFTLEDRPATYSQENTSKQAKCVRYAKLAFALLAIVTLTFCACLDAYFAYTSADEGLAFIVTCLVAAIVFDLVLQLVLTVALSAAQFYCEVRNRQPFFDTDKVMRLTDQARQIAQQIFYHYEDQAALLKISYEDDPMLEQIEKENEKETVSHSSPKVNMQMHQNEGESAGNIGIKDIKVKESITKVQIGGYSIQITETLRFRPPRVPTIVDKSASKINIVKPNAAPKAPLDQMAFSSGDEEAQRKRKKIDFGQFERNQKFFAGQMPIVQKHLRKQKPCDQKQTAKILRQSIDNIELENIEGDFSSCHGQKLNSKNQSQTPEKIKAAARKSSIAGYSSNKKVSQFETPRMSTVKLKHPSVTAQAEGAPSDYEMQQNDNLMQEVQRRLTLKRSSNSGTDSNHVTAGRLDSLKKYAEDDDMMQGVVGMILGNSSKSIARADLGSHESARKSLGATAAQASIKYEDAYQSGQQYHTGRPSAERREPPLDREFYLQDKYSPVFSSVNRKDGSQVAGANTQHDQPMNEREIQLAPSNVPIQASVGRLIHNYQPTSPIQNETQPNLPGTAGNFKQNDSSSSQLVQAILSQKEVLSKAQSFNSPKSLKSKLQLTNEKIQSSIEKSSLKHGRRKMVMLDEAGPSKQSLNYGGGPNTAGALNNQLSDVFRIHAKSLAGSSGTATPLINQDASNKTIGEPMGIALAAVQQNTQVLFEDQGNVNCKSGVKVRSMKKEGLLSSRIINEKRDFSKDGSKVIFSNDKKFTDGDKAASSIVASAAKRSSIASKIIGEARTPGSISGIQNSTEKQMSAQGGGQPSAFQRLIMASKRMVQRQSSEKKEQQQNRLHKIYAGENNAANPQVRSHSQATNDTAQMLKEQSKAIYSLPFKIGLMNKGKNNKHDGKSTNSRRQSVETQEERNFAEPKPLARIESVEQKSGVDPDMVSSGGKIGGHLQNNLSQRGNERISELLDQESYDLDTPMDRPKARDGRVGRDGREGKQVQISKQHLDPSSSSSQYKVPEFFKKEQVNPVKISTSNILNQSQHLEDQEEQQAERRFAKHNKNGSNAAMRESDDQCNNDYLKVSNQDKKTVNRGFKQRKNSQLTTTKEGNPMTNKRRGSKNSHQYTKVSGSREKQHGSSRENTMSNCSIDFDKMDKHREEEASEYSKLISQASTMNRLEDQRRRLESFLSLAQQAKSKRDIEKIQGMIRQIDETGKPLPMSRINELKLLELMASPYNQSLIAMIKVELDIAKKVRDLRKAQYRAENNRSKFSLPKHLTSVASRVINNDISQDNLSQPPCIVGGESDTHLTRVINVRPKGISSCRSNNDVATRTFQRSPGHFQQQSPLSHQINQPVLSSKVRNDSNDQRDSSVTGGRYSYLRSVGNAVVAHEDVRKSVDRIRMSNEHDKHMKSKSDLDMLQATRFEEIGRRGTAPTPLETEEVGRLPKSSLNYLKPDLVFVQDSRKNGQKTQLQSQSDLLIEKAVAENKERSYTSYNIPAQQKVGPMMLGENGFIKRISAPPTQSKSALAGTNGGNAGNKENQMQPKAHR